MAPSAAISEEQHQLPIHEKARKPLKLGKSLEKYQSFDLTPIIGTEFENVDLTEWLHAPNSDDLLRDLAITVSRRGVVFFRKQDNLDSTLQKQLIQRLGELSGKPSSSSLHVHPVIKTKEVEDREISAIDSTKAKIVFAADDGDGNADVDDAAVHLDQSRLDEWHSDITFENVPSDYAVLRLTHLPKTGGDTLWASGYELYDRLSPPIRALLDSLTATYSQPKFRAAAAAGHVQLYTSARGSPQNTGDSLTASHPVVRTNPVTGWKSIFAVGHHVERINGLARAESRALLRWFLELIVRNHDLQVRFRWRSVNDVAIWDNRCTYHAATPDFEGLGVRKGQRAVSIGERPFLDPSSVSRRQALAAESKEV